MAYTKLVVIAALFGALNAFPMKQFAMKGSIGGDQQLDGPNPPSSSDILARPGSDSDSGDD